MVQERDPAEDGDLRGLDAGALEIVRRLHLSPHPEGGFFVRDWQSGRVDRASGRPLASLIYFLLPAGAASSWHLVDGDELWLWHGPGRLTLQTGGRGERPSDGSLHGVLLGPPEGGGAGHAVVPSGTWQRTLPARGDVLVSCVVAPGFVYSGFHLAPPGNK